MLFSREDQICWAGFDRVRSRVERSPVKAGVSILFSESSRKIFRMNATRFLPQRSVKLIGTWIPTSKERRCNYKKSEQIPDLKLGRSHILLALCSLEGNSSYLLTFFNYDHLLVNLKTHI